MVSVITRLLTILSAFVTGAFLTYLVQLQLIPAKTTLSKIESVAKVTSETKALNTANETLTTTLSPKPSSKQVAPSENRLEDTKNDSTPGNVIKNENELAKEKIEVSDTDTQKVDESAYELVLVESGDSLSRLSIRHYDSKDFAYNIYEANRDVLKSPDHLVPGMQLKIPANPEEYN